MSFRTLSKADAQWFENTKSIVQFRSKYMIFSLTDKKFIGRININRSLTRAFADEEVGPLDQDEWLWIISNNINKDPSGFKWVKVWIGILTFPGKNSHLVQQYSQQREDLEWEGRVN